MSLLGVSSGAVLVFDVPSKGSNIMLSEVLEEHTDAVSDMASECSGSEVKYLHQQQLLWLVKVI